MNKNKKIEEHLPDVQKQTPTHLLSIDRVGVSGVDFPLTLKKKDSNETVVVDAKFNMFGSLVKEKKGIDMSRFTSVLMGWHGKPLYGENLKDLARKMQYTLQANDIYISSNFRYYMSKQSPVTKLDMIMSYKCNFVSIVFKSDYKFYQEVTVPITSCCPCSKTMSLTDAKNGIGKGAHNQRGLITLQVKCTPKSVWLEDLIKLCESSGSCEIYSLLKRPDEKYVTEKAYNNPKFVEDITREVAKKIMLVPGISWFRVKTENFESIHDHSATCYMERMKKGKKWIVSYKGLI